MPAYGIEIILNRQLADCLNMPVFITDTTGNLIFYNEPAEKVLGSRFDETGELKMDEWGTMFKQKDDEGEEIPAGQLPLSKTIMDQKPHHKSFWIESLQGKKEKISVTSYPIIGRAGTFLGAVAIFWEIT
jgi:PAS domain-containing protein